MKAFVPYSYYLCWTPLNLHYYGIEFKKTAHPSNLWVSYFSSSKLVKYTRAYHGEPDIIEVRKIFDSADKARNWEHKVLKRLKVTQRKDWLNPTDHISFSLESCRKKKPGNGKSKKPNNGGYFKGLTKENCPSLLKISLKMRKPKSKEHKLHLKWSEERKEQFKLINPMNNKDSRDKISIALTGRQNPWNIERNKINPPAFGKHWIQKRTGIRYNKEVAI